MGSSTSDSSSQGPSLPILGRDINRAFIAEGVSSKFVNKDIGRLRRRYKISEDIVLRLPGNGEWACSSNGEDVVLYEEILVVGLRLPFRPFERGLLHHLGLAPTKSGKKAVTEKGTSSKKEGNMGREGRQSKPLSPAKVKASGKVHVYHEIPHSSSASKEKGVVSNEDQSHHLQYLLSSLEKGHNELLGKVEVLQGEISDAKKTAILEFKTSEDYQDDTHHFYVGGFEHFRKRVALAFGNVQDWSMVKIFDEDTTTVEGDSEDEEEEDDVQSKERVVTPPNIHSTPPSGDQSVDPTAGPVDGQVTSVDDQATPPPVGNEAP
uniref:Uncharacterized protein n=1 Tax=Fagus sylvatica TaxID=28930 RepID=A0A2N9H4K7_FAGSY